ncbi:BON domain-containing protein [Snodgrassella sp. ESL0253]|uniref:BON domain-containing protein n=1 Tax=Snodgrassella sp. ESL0253 TaxID=2705031 RepID=UPI0015818E8F|nr:BON domain-containing protein [Snodgrassella sp. ESL0253]NUE67427.1 BON domain-containing protein [Snodgrassella sp. ESL0253]
MKKYFSALALGLCLTTTLSGCPAVLVGGATVGTLSAIDRRTTGAQTDDKIMEVRILDGAMSYLNSQAQQSKFQPTLSVISYNRQILLLGLVANENDKNLVERVARAQPAAQKVYNYIDIANQSRKLNHVTDDTWITSKIRSNLLNTKGVFPKHVKVVTYNGVTYVMGILTPAEQQAATAAISTTSGVQKVVTLYQTFENTPNSTQTTP